MGQIILLALAAIVWAVIKAVSQQPPQRPVPRRAAPGPSPVSEPPRPEIRPVLQHDPGSYSDQQSEIRMEVQELDDYPALDLHVTPEGLVQGVIMAEVLGPPRAKNPHRLFGR